MRTVATKEASRMEELAQAVGSRAQSVLDAGASTLGTVRGKAVAFGHSTDGYVHTNPWLAIGAAAGAGLIAGFLLRGAVRAVR